MAVISQRLSLYPIFDACWGAKLSAAVVQSIPIYFERQTNKYLLPQSDAFVLDWMMYLSLPTGDKTTY